MNEQARKVGADTRPGTPGIGDVTPVARDGHSAIDEERIVAAHDVYVKGEVSSIGALVADITADLSTLMRQELELAKAEARSSAEHAAKGAGMMGAAALAAHFALLFLTIALWWAIGMVIDSLGWAGVIVAALWAVVAAVLAVMGRRNLKQIQAVPQTVETAKKVPDAMRGRENRA